MEFLAAILLVLGLGYLGWAGWRKRTINGTQAELWALMAITGGSVIIRSIFLGQSSLEHLEASYLFEAVKPDSLWGVLTSRQSAEQMHQPLFPMLLRLWAAVGTTETIIRIPSLVFSAACIPMVWVLVRHELSQSSALWAAGLTAVAPLMVWYGRDCSPYALLAYLSLVAMVSAQQALHDKSVRSAVMTSIALALAFYTHFHGAWVVISVGLWMLVHHRPSFWRTTGVTTLFVLPWIGVMLSKLSTSVQALVEDRPIMRYSHELSEALSEAMRMVFGGPKAAWILTALLAVFGMVLLIKQRKRFGTLLLICSVTAVVAELHIMWQLNQSKGIVYVDVRHYIYMVPLFMAAIASLPRKVPIVIALVVQVWSSLPLVTTLEKPAVREAAEWIKSHADSSHGVALLPAPWYHPILEYYLLGICPKLVHARSFDGWWRYSDCQLEETPMPNSVYGFPGTPERIFQSSQRQNLKYIWVLDIRDHRFGLPVPPTEPQEQFLCWKEREKAELLSRKFGPWVKVSLYDSRQLQMTKPPKYNPMPVSTVTSKQSWELNCNALDP